MDGGGGIAAALWPAHGGARPRGAEWPAVGRRATAVGKGGAPLSLLAGLTALGTHLVHRYGTAGVFAGMTLESAGIPLPSEVIMPLGALGAHGAGGVAVIIAAGTAGNLLGSWIAYGVGAALGAGTLRARWLQPRHLEAGHAWFERYGDRAVFFGRILPVIRTYISFPAGAAAMPWGRFTAYTVLGSVLWSGALAVAGYELGAHWTAIQPWFDRYSVLALGLLLLAVAARLLAGWLNARQRAGAGGNRPRPR